MKKYTKPELTIASFEASDAIAAINVASAALGSAGHDFGKINFTDINFS